MDCHCWLVWSESPCAACARATLFMLDWKSVMDWKFPSMEVSYSNASKSLISHWWPRDKNCIETLGDLVTPWDPSGPIPHVDEAEQITIPKPSAIWVVFQPSPNARFCSLFGSVYHIIWGNNDSMTIKNRDKHMMIESSFTIKIILPIIDIIPWNHI